MVERRRGARVALGVAGALLVGSFAVGTALAADHAVAISGFSFSPADLTVTVGDTATWTNSDAQAHTATADGASFDTGPIANGASATVTFATAGSFPYHCSIHSTMTGTVTVEAAAPASTPTARPTTPPTDAVADDAGSGSSSGAAVVALLVGVAWAGAFAVARRRAARG